LGLSFGFVLWFLVMLHGPYTYPSVSSLSLDQSNQWHSPNGKITQQCFCFWWQNRRALLLNFGNAKKLCLFCLMRQQHYWKYFAFNQSHLAKGKIAPVVLLPH